jgi:hypothetical protein
VSPLKLPRTIRLDASDTFVFARAAEPGEWAVTGAFLFIDVDPATLPPKERAAFRSGFLGVASFGWSTLAVVTEATQEERRQAVEALAARLVSDLGAPDVATARAAAEEEIAFAASLCDHPPQTLLALRRSAADGEVREQFRTLSPRGDRPKDAFRAFTFIESDEPEIEERVDLLSLAGDATTGRAKP